MNRNLVAQARKQLLRRGRALLRAAQAGTGGRPGGLGSMGEAEVAELQEIHAALERIERGIFGRCDDCQGSVEESRLEQLPWERCCAACRGEAVVEAEAPAAGAARVSA